MYFILFLGRTIKVLKVGSACNFFFKKATRNNFVRLRRIVKVYILVPELCLLFWRITLLLWSFELSSRIQVVKLEVTEIYY